MKKPNKTAMIGPYRVKPGDTIDIIIRHVSRSGMSRRMDCYLIRRDRPIWITALVAEITGYSLNKRHDELVIGGCGMDMGFSLVYTLASKLFPRGFYIRPNDWPRNNDPEIKETRIDPSGGYALKHRYM